MSVIAKWILMIALVSAPASLWAASTSAANELLDTARAESGGSAAMVKYLESSVKKNPKDMRLQMLLADWYQKNGQSSEAIRQLKRCLESEPSDKNLPGRLCKAYEDAGQWKKGLEFFDRFQRKLESYDDQQLSANLMIRLAKLGGNLDGFVSKTETQLAKNPGDSALHRRLLTGYLAARRPSEQILTEAESAAKLFPNDKGFQLQLANVYQHQGKTDQAIQNLRGMLSAQPDDDRVRLRLVRALIQAGQLKEAEAAVKEGMKLKPDNADYTEQAAEISFLQGRIDQAILKYKDLLSRPGSDELKKRYSTRLEEISQTKPKH